MAPLTDPIRLAAFRDALGNWSFKGYVQFELNETAHRWLRSHFDGITLKELGRLMWEYVMAGGQVDEVRETRPEWKNDYDFHYDLRFEIQGQRVYIESRLSFTLPLAPDESRIVVVNIHAP